MTVRLILEQPCPTCAGVGRILVVDTPHRAHEEPCKACKETGVRVSPVSCAGCKHWNQGYYCSKTDTFNCEPDHGCKLWTAKEGTDGNG